MKRVLLTLSMSIATLVGTLAQNEPYKNHQLSPKERADDLLGRLTLKEKIGLMQNSSNAVERLGIAPYNWWSEWITWCCPQWAGNSISDNDGNGLYF